MAEGTIKKQLTNGPTEKSSAVTQFMKRGRDLKNTGASPVRRAAGNVPGAVYNYTETLKEKQVDPLCLLRSVK